MYDLLDEKVLLNAIGMYIVRQLGTKLETQCCVM